MCKGERGQGEMDTLSDSQEERGEITYAMLHVTHLFTFFYSLHPLVSYRGFSRHVIGPGYSLTCIADLRGCRAVRVVYVFQERTGANGRRASRAC